METGAYGDFFIRASKFEHFNLQNPFIRVFFKKGKLSKKNEKLRKKTNSFEKKRNAPKKNESYGSFSFLLKNYENLLISKKLHKRDKINLFDQSS
jgi:hypothetical protein